MELLDRVAVALADPRDPERITHGLSSMVKQRLFALCLGHEHLSDHWGLRGDLLLQTTVEPHRARPRALLIIDVGLNTLRPAADERASKPKVANAAKATHAAPRPHARFPPPRTGSGVPRAGRIVRQRTDRAAQA